MTSNGMEPEYSAATRIPGVIPHFFYDLIGRILPGAYLIAGLAVIARKQPGLQWVWDHLTRLAAPNATGGFYLLMATVGVLASLSGAYLIGFLMGAVSFWAVEMLWDRLSPMDFDRLLKSFSMPDGQKKNLRNAFKKQFGFDLDPKDHAQPGGGQAGETNNQVPLRHMGETSSLCSYYVWANNPNLGYMTSRWDAEALASRSVLASSAILALFRTFQVVDWCVNGQGLKPWLLAIFGLIGLGAYLNYEFLRRKQLQGRYALFQALRSTLSNPGERRHLHSSG